MKEITLPAWETLPDIGLYMDQVVTLTERALPLGGITKAMVNNYVKTGLLPRPSGKKYDREHLALLLEIAVLKQAMSMEDIATLLSWLGEDGAQAGYMHFCTELEAITAGIARGSIDAGGGDDALTGALRMSLAAALCSLDARGRLAMARR